MPALYLTEDDVRQLLDMRTALDAVEEAFRRLAAGEAMHVPRHRAQASGIVLHSMIAAAGYLGVVGWKNYTTTRAGARFHVGLYDGQSGALLALLEAEYLGRVRTGATSGVAAALLAPGNAVELGLLGAGRQAETQLAALAAVRPLQRAYVYSRSQQRRESFAEKMSAELELEVTPVDRPAAAVEDLPIVITATSSAEPVLDGNMLAEGALVCAIGSNWLSKAEIDTATVRRADHIVCDSIEACRKEAGDFVDALEKGVFDWRRAVELADVVSGRAPTRSRADQTILFKSVGLALEDVAVAARVVELARHQGLGQTLPIG